MNRVCFSEYELVNIYIDAIGGYLEQDLKQATRSIIDEFTKQYDKTEYLVIGEMVRDIVEIHEEIVCDELFYYVTNSWYESNASIHNLINYYFLNQNSDNQYNKISDKIIDTAINDIRIVFDDLNLISNSEPNLSNADLIFEILIAEVQLYKQTIEEIFNSIDKKIIELSDDNQIGYSFLPLAKAFKYIFIEYANYIDFRVANLINEYNIAINKTEKVISDKYYTYMDDSVSNNDDKNQKNSNNDAKSSANSIHNSKPSKIPTNLGILSVLSSINVNDFNKSYINKLRKFGLKFLGEKEIELDTLNDFTNWIADTLTYKSEYKLISELVKIQLYFFKQIAPFLEPQELSDDFANDPCKHIILEENKNNFINQDDKEVYTKNYKSPWSYYTAVNMLINQCSKESSNEVIRIMFVIKEVISKMAGIDVSKDKNKIAFNKCAGEFIFNLIGEPIPLVCIDNKQNKNEDKYKSEEALKNENNLTSKLSDRDNLSDAKISTSEFSDLDNLSDEEISNYIINGKENDIEKLLQNKNSEKLDFGKILNILFKKMPASKKEIFNKKFDEFSKYLNDNFPEIIQCYNEVGEIYKNDLEYMSNIYSEINNNKLMDEKEDNANFLSDVTMLGECIDNLNNDLQVYHDVKKEDIYSKYKLGYFAEKAEDHWKGIFKGIFKLTPKIVQVIADPVASFLARKVEEHTDKKIYDDRNVKKKFIELVIGKYNFLPNTIENVNELYNFQYYNSVNKNYNDIISFLKFPYISICYEPYYDKYLKNNIIANKTRIKEIHKMFLITKIYTERKYGLDISIRSEEVASLFYDNFNRTFNSFYTNKGISKISIDIIKSTNKMCVEVYDYPEFDYKTLKIKHDDKKRVFGSSLHRDI